MHTVPFNMCSFPKPILCEPSNRRKYIFIFLQGLMLVFDSCRFKIEEIKSYMMSIRSVKISRRKTMSIMKMK